MRRRLLALLFCVTAWAIVAHLDAASARPTPQAAADLGWAATTDSAPEGAADPGRQWSAAYRANASFTESRWTSSGFHAVLAASPSATPVVEAATLARRTDASAHRPAHLLHTPLLI